jgi:putative peptidoglycan lipid II flippase
VRTSSTIDDGSGASAALRIVRPAISLAALSAVGLVLTVAWQLSIAALFGTSSELDAFWIALALPKAVIDSLHLGLLTLVFILIFNLDGGQAGDEASRDELASSASNLVLLATLLFIPLLVLLSPYLTRWMAPGLAPDLQALSGRMLRLLGLVLIPTALTGVLAGILHARQRFVPFATARVAGLLAQIAVLYALARTLTAPVWALVWATFAGALVVLLLCVPPFRKVAFRHRAILRSPSSSGREVLKLFAVLVIFAMLDRLNQVTDRFFASFLAPGSVSALEFGWRFEIPIAHVLSMSVALPSLAIMASQAAERKWIELRATVATSVRLLMLAVLPVVGFLVILRDPLVVLWFQRGEFSPESARLVSSLIPALGLIFVMRAFGTITVYGLLAVRKLRALLTVLTIEVAINVVLNLLLRPLGLPGVVLATALSMVLSSIWVAALLLESLQGWTLRELAWEVRKPFAASLGSIVFLFAIATLVGGRAGESFLVRSAELSALGIAYLLIHLLLCQRLGLVELRVDGGWPRLRLGAREWSNRGVNAAAAETTLD